MQAFDQNKVAPVLPFKNLAGALLFCVFLGPVGLLYASSAGGITMIVIGFIVACFKFMVPVILVWLICCIWSVLAVNKYNKKIVTELTQVKKTL
jgi:hypothetical protein